MGCGQSSLKGEKQEDQEAPKPIKKVETNFSTVNYDAAPNTGRRNTEYAPHDEVREHKPSEALSPGTERHTNPLSVDAGTTPAASTQPEATTTSTSTAFENKLPDQTAQNPAGEDITKTEPYKDVTASPDTPIAPNINAAFPESQQTVKPAQPAQ